MRHTLVLSGVAALLVGLVACDDEYPTNHEDPVEADAEGWCGVQSMLASQCQACHQGASAAGGLDLAEDPHGALVDQPSAQFEGQVLVLPGQPESSLLYLKITDTQGNSLGGVMPPSGAVDAQLAELVSDWILEGGSDQCEEPVDGERYHPEDFAEPTVHPLEAKLHEQTCTDCHGEELDGGSAGVSCDTCHTPDDPPAWRSDCTFCHGGVEDSTGAPPEEIDDGQQDLAFGAHARHVQDNNHAAFSCEQCHATPTDVLTPGHLFDSTPALAETDFLGGLSPEGVWSGSGCSDLYCHGNGRGEGSVQVADAPLSCDSCHPDESSGESRWDTMSGEHDDHLADAGLSCGDCHSQTVDMAQGIVDPAKHVDGKVQFAPASGTVAYSGGECNGSCHGENHDRRDWK